MLELFSMREREDDQKSLLFSFIHSRLHSPALEKKKFPSSGLAAIKGKGGKEAHKGKSGGIGESLLKLMKVQIIFPLPFLKLMCKNTIRETKHEEKFC